MNHEILIEIKNLLDIIKITQLNRQTHKDSIILPLNMNKLQINTHL